MTRTWRTFEDDVGVVGKLILTGLLVGTVLSATLLPNREQTREPKTNQRQEETIKTRERESRWYDSDINQIPSTYQGRPIDYSKNPTSKLEISNTYNPIPEVE